MDHSLQITILVGSWPLSSQTLSLFCHSPSQQNIAEKVRDGKKKKGTSNQIESEASLIKQSRTGTGTVLKVNSCVQEQTHWLRDKRNICNPSDLLHYHHTLKQECFTLDPGGERGNKFRKYIKECFTLLPGGERSNTFCKYITINNALSCPKTCKYDVYRAATIHRIP